MIKSNRRKKRTKTVICLFILVFLILLAVCAVIYIKRYRPEPDSEIPFDIGEEGYKPSVDSSVGEFQRKSEVYNILVVGKDKVALNTDIMMLVHVDAQNQQVTVLQLPRDTYFDGNKLNAQYAAHYLASSDSDKQVQSGMEGLKKDIEKTLCVKIDYTALVTLEGFSSIVDLIGGVEVDVPFDMKYNDPAQDLYIDIKAGKQRLDGETAVKFVRFRNSFVEGDLGRMDSTKLFLSAFLAQFKKNLNISTLPGMVSAAIKNVTTTMSLMDIVYFGEIALNLDLNNVSFLTLPGLDAREYGDSGRWFYIAHRADCLNAVNRYINLYTSDISSSIFDKNTALCDQSKTKFKEIYYAKASENLKKYTASDIQENGIDILHY